MTSKLGLHVNNLVDKEELAEFILSARPAIMKTMKFDKDFWHDMKRQHPTMRLICRVYVEDRELFKRIMADPEKAARWYVDDHILHNVLPIVDILKNGAVEGVNEMGRHDANVWRHLGCFDWFMAEFLSPYGIPYAAGNFGVGHPSDLYFMMLPEVVDAFSHDNCAMIDCHEYSAPHMRSEFIHKPDEVNEEDGGWLTLRFLKWYPLLPTAAQKPLYIGETGVDGGINPSNPWPGIVQGGWKTNIGNEDVYVSGPDNLAWYDGVLQRHDYVVGATIFCYVRDTDPDWASFNMRHSALRKLGQHIQSQTSMQDYLGEAMQEFVIPANPSAFFQQYAQAHGLGAARSPEQGYDGELWWGGHPYLAQVFMRDAYMELQYVVYAQLDLDLPWHEKTGHFVRDN